MLILVDSREQLPYWKGSACAKTALIVGDYTTANLLNKFHIERKSGSDLYGTLTRGMPRFRKEILRALDHHIKLVVLVELSRADFVALKIPYAHKLKVKGESLDKTITTLEQKYKLQFVWCRHRKHGCESVLNLLTKMEKGAKKKARISPRLS